MKNFWRKMSENMGSFLNNDTVIPNVKYGIAPPTYMNTEPRFDKPPTSQATAAGKRDSSMGPNPQAGKTLYPQRREHLDENQQYAMDIEGPTGVPSVMGDISPSIDSGFYRDDPRKPDVRSIQFGYVPVPRTGGQFGDQGYGRNTTPVVIPTVQAYQGSQDQFANSPIYEIGGANFAPRQSQYSVKQEHDDPNAHPGQEWIQPHENAIGHTVGHDHPFGHNDHCYRPVRFSHSYGNGPSQTENQP